MVSEPDLWRERYSALFEANIAGVVFTLPNGELVDCNEPFAHAFGFVSRAEILAQSAWDFYFQRSEREKLIHQLRTNGTSPAQEARLRGRFGVPVWVLTKRAVVSRVNGVPNLLMGTVVDLAVLKEVRERLKPRAMETTYACDEEICNLSQRTRILLSCVGRNLESIGHDDALKIRECFADLEEAKMLLSRLEILRLSRFETLG